MLETTYRLAFEDQSEIQRLGKEADDLARSAQDELDRWSAVERKRLKIRAAKPLPSDLVQAKYKELCQKYKHERKWEEAEKAKNAREESLDSMAKAIHFESSGEWQVVKRSYRNNFTSQTQPELYSRGVLLPLADKLDLLSIPTEILESNDHFELNARCPVWMADAAERTITIHDVRKTCRDHGLNIRVYHPGLKWLGSET